MTAILIGVSRKIVTDSVTLRQKHDAERAHFIKVQNFICNKFRFANFEGDITGVSYAPGETITDIKSVCVEAHIGCDYYFFITTAIDNMTLHAVCYCGSTEITSCNYRSYLHFRSYFQTGLALLIAA